MSPWLRQVAELVHAKRRAEAIALVRSRAEAGDLAAKVRLALFGVEAGISAEETGSIIDQAEATIRAEDSDAQWMLHSAYELRLGTCDYDERARRALSHLEAYAELSESSLASYAVAVRYGQGDIGTPADQVRAFKWMHRAAELGNPLAGQFLTRNADA
jgi:TPR repeat protein